MSQFPRSPVFRNKTYLIFLIVVLVKIFIFAWMAHFGFPRTTGDALVLQQPAYMHLFHGHFSVPTAQWRVPYTDITFGAYPPGYTLVSLFVFKLFGFQMQSMVILDLVVHLLLSISIAVALLLVFRSTLVAGTFLLASSFLIIPRGRPEELAALLTCAVVFVAIKNRSVPLVGFLLGLVFTVHPVPGVIAFIILVWIDLFRHRKLGQVALRSSLLLAMAFGTLAIIWIATVYPNLREAVDQFLEHRKYRYTPNVIEMFTGFPIASLTLFITLAISISGAISRISIRRMTDQLSPAASSVLWFLATCLPILVLVHLVFKSPAYYYRLVSYIALAGSIALLTIFFSVSPGMRSLPRNILRFSRIILCITLLVANADIVRYVLLPFSWTSENCTYQDALETVRKTVPKDATVGGDPILWWTINDGRPYYYASGWYQGSEPLDYVLSGTFWKDGGKPNILLDPVWEDLLNNSYEEIGNLKRSPGPPILSIAGLKIPLSRTSSDWSVRIWKRKGTGLSPSKP